MIPELATDRKTSIPINTNLTVQGSPSHCGRIVPGGTEDVEIDFVR